jgi:hypothetical protein
MALVDDARAGKLGPSAMAYHQGYLDGLAETINQIEGRSDVAPAGNYRGPLPDELVIWLTNVRKRLDMERAK